MQNEKMIYCYLKIFYLRKTSKYNFQSKLFYTLENIIICELCIYIVFARANFRCVLTKNAQITELFLYAPLSDRFFPPNAQY
jgi:hypothetical protein